jgi:CheY-like chemotaxis protein
MLTAETAALLRRLLSLPQSVLPTAHMLLFSPLQQRRSIPHPFWTAAGMPASDYLVARRQQGWYARRVKQREECMILIVDDDETILEMLSERLEEMGYSVHTAHETLQAYSKLKDPNCRLMILDLNMPKINGAELLLLMASEGIDVPTIVTASNMPDLTEDEMEDFPHVVGFRQKPYTQEDIISLIDTHARKYNA